MAIKFKCDCGKALSAREIYAGRKVRCPKCEKKVTVPEPEEVDEEREEKKGRARSRGGLEAELLVGEEEIVFATKPGMGVLIFRLVLLNVVYVLSVIAPLLVLTLFLRRFDLALPGGTVTHLVLVALALLIIIVLNALVWLTWQKSVYVLTASCVVARGGIFFSSVQRMPLGKVGAIRQLRFGRGLAFYGS